MSVIATLARNAYAGDLSRVVRTLRQQPPPAALPAMPLDPQLLQLVNRASFGFTRASYEEAALLGYDGFLESQLDYESIDDSALDARLAAFPTLTMTMQELWDNYELDSGVPILELMQASFERAAYSKRQLYECMVEFWSDHFNINILKDLCAFFKPGDDRDVIRQHAMSTFPELLNASARSAAMLFYLDNYTNIVGNAQENYARELLELHTLSVDGPYTQQDVQEVARCLTGWTIAWHDNPVGFGTFVFYPPHHDLESKIFLEQYIPAGGGLSDGQTVLDILAYHPSTAHFISQKLCIRFLGYDPPEDIVSSVTATYMATGGDIKEMLRVIFRAPIMDYYATPKFKRPFHQVASMLRATDTVVNDPDYAFLYVLFVMGHAPFFWTSPDGYPDAANSWTSSQVPRWQSASWLFDGVLPAGFDLLGLIQSEGGDLPGEQGAAINRILTGGAMSVDEEAQLQQFYDDVSALDPLALEDTFGLAASMPGFQWY